MKAALFVLAFPFLAAEAADPRVLMEKGHWKRARTFAEQRYRGAPGDAEANYLMARARFAFGDRSGAIPFAEKAVALSPNNPDYRFHLGQLYGEEARSAGIFGGLGLARKFRKEAEAALALDPRHREAQIAMMHFYFQAPGVIGGDKRKARAIVDHLIRTDPVTGYVAKARLAPLDKDRGNLEIYYRKAVEADSQRYESHVELAHYYTDKPELAEKSARDALKLDPAREPAYTIIAASLAAQGRFDEMERILAQAEKSVPDNPHPYYKTGEVLLSRGKLLERVDAFFRKYLSQEPEAGTPPHGYARWRRALVLEKLNRGSEAVSELEAAVQLLPNFQPARKDLKRLKR